MLRLPLRTTVLEKKVGWPPGPKVEEKQTRGASQRVHRLGGQRVGVVLVETRGTPGGGNGGAEVPIAAITCRAHNPGLPPGRHRHTANPPNRPGSGSACGRPRW